MRRVTYITNARSQSGVGERGTMIKKVLRTKHDVSLDHWHLDGDTGQILHNSKHIERLGPWPYFLGSKSINWIRLGYHLVSYLSKAEGVFHMTNQSLSFLARRLSPSVVTVHDIIELTNPQDYRAYWLNRYLYSGIQKADRIICVSHYTQQMIQERLGVGDGKITVIHNGVAKMFHPIPNFHDTVGFYELQRELRIPNDAKVILYVGSDHPRKNLTALAEILAGLSDPQTFLVKVGAPGILSGRESFLAVLDDLGVRDRVRIFDSVTNERLNELYNFADVFVFPSLLEGFGLPPLQAMAAGLPVVTANSTSLPEILGQDEEAAALFYDPLDFEGMTNGVRTIFENREERERLKQKGLRRAARFSWDVAAEQVSEVYRELL